MFRVLVLLLALISIVLGQDSLNGELPPLPAPIGCKSVDQFDECVRPAAKAMLCHADDISCVCSAYRIERGCYTSYCPGNSWEYEDRGTTCGPTKTAAATASAINAGAPSHVSATPTKGTNAKGDTHKSSSAEATASSRVNAGGPSAMIPISGLLLVVAATLSTLILR
ncbi:hypothetical protein MMC29_007158 [Sticta canariensis]|nr:hypothetical protein [Sticta canariensis]